MRIKISYVLCALFFALASAQSFALSEAVQHRQYKSARIEFLAGMGASLAAIALFEKFMRSAISLANNPYNNQEAIESFSDFCRQFIPSKSSFLFMSGILLALNAQNIVQLFDLLAQKAEGKIKATL